MIAVNQKYNKTDNLKRAFDYLEKRLKINLKKTNAKKAGEVTKRYFSGVGLIGAKPKKSKKTEKTTENKNQTPEVPEDIKDTW